MQQIKRTLFPLFIFLLLFLSTSITAFAYGEGNIDNGSGNMGDGTKTDVWNLQDGIRITVVTTDGNIVSTPFDLTNWSISDGIINFGKVCKLQYSSGNVLSPSGSYYCSSPGIAIPRIISSSNSKANIESIKRYFCSEYQNSKRRYFYSD